jgi:SAM-dependent methyltransferase
MTKLGPDDILWDFLRGALACRALAIAADLGISEALADGPRPVAELAREVGADEDFLRRCLRALASDGVFAENEPGVFANSPASDLLRTPSWRAFAHLWGGIWHSAAGHLGPAGGATFPLLYGAGFWDWLELNPEERALFDQAMVEGVERRADRLAAIDWRGDETVVDVGGGNGSLLAELLRRHEGMHGIVFDLPETVRDEDDFGDRCSFVAGSFFESVPPGDVHVLATILHDWDDESATRILRTIRAAAAPDGRLIILDAVVPYGNEPHGAKWLDLLMLALFDGRERDAEQWRALLAAGGFEPVRLDDGLIEARCL